MLFYDFMIFNFDLKIELIVRSSVSYPQERKVKLLYYILLFSTLFFGNCQNQFKRTLFTMFSPITFHQ